MSTRSAELARRTIQSLAGGMLATAVVALFEAIWARNAAPTGMIPEFGGAFEVCFGLVAPVGLGCAALVSLFAVWLSPEHPASLSTSLANLRALGTGRPADVAAFAPLGVVAAFVWTTASAHLARAVLALDVRSGLAGLAMSAGALGLGLALAVITLAAVPSLRRGLARLSETQPAWVDPVTTGAGAVVLVIGLVAVGVVTGTVSGEGGALGIYGIFKRPELDLRAPIELVMIALGALVAPSFSRPPRTPSRMSLALLFALSLAPLLLFYRDARAMNLEPTLTQSVERGAPLGKLVLKPARKLTDRDGDGVSGLFGGGDCNDHDPRINPFAQEIMDNGIDEDCSGADLTRAAVDRVLDGPAPASAKVDESLVPRDLNVVLITIDTLRADLGFAGYPKAITPHLDALAARSTVFERAYSLASYTGKSVGPLLIGKYGSETNRNWGHFNKFNEKDTFVAERLERAGIRTLAVHGHRYFDVGSGLERGFDVRDFSAAPAKEADWAVDNRSTSAELSDAAISILSKEENTKGRFFLWIHYLDPHADYLKHEGIDFGSDARGLYDAEVAFTDQHVGRLLDAIDKASWGKRTAIIVSSDHGEAFNDHGMNNHGRELWESLVHVPLVVFVPGAKPHRIAERRSAIDVVPTLLELFHLERPHGEGTDFVSGVSLLTDVFLEQGATPAKRDVFIDMPGGPYNDPRRALIHDDDKLIVSGESHFELFDLAADPGENKNLADTDAARMAAMKERYAATKTRLREVKVTGPRK